MRRSGLSPTVRVSLAACIALSSAAAHALGGDDVRVFRASDLDEIYAGHGKCVLTTSDDGELFAVVARGLLDIGVCVYRSDDGGTRWSEWDRIASLVLPDAIDFALAPGTPNRCIVVREELGDLWIESAEIDDPTPSWQSTQVGTITYQFANVAVATRDGGTAAADVYVATVTETHDLTFARSTDGGVTFAAPIVLETLDSNFYYQVDLVADAGNRVRLVWTENDADADVVTVSYREATNGGAAIGNWAPAVVLEAVNSLQSSSVPVSIAAAPGDNDLLVAAGTRSTGDIRLYHSPDGGATWDQFEIVDNAMNPALTWGTAGPALVNNTNGFAGFFLARPSTADPTSAWVNELMLARSTSAPHGSDVTSDPTRGGQFAMIGVGDAGVGFEPELWFDAEWRDAAGYGLSELGTPVDLAASITSAPAIADLEPDGDLDVIVTLSDDTIASFDMVEGVLTNFGVVGPTSSASAPIVANAFESEACEIFVGLDSGTVAGLSETGAPLAGWPVVLGTGAPVYVSAGIVTSSHLDIVAASDNRVWLLRPDGTIAHGFPFVADAAWGDVAGRVAIGDVDEDGDNELVAAFTSRVVALSAVGQILWTIYNSPNDLSSGVTLGDVDGNGDLEVALPFVTGVVGLRHHTGAQFGGGWPFDTGTGSPIGPIALAASDDSSPEPLLHFLNADGEGYCVDVAGNLRPGFPRVTAAGTLLREAIVNRLGPGSGPVEMLVGTPTGFAHVWDTGTGANVEGWRRDVLEPIEVACGAADLENDGDVEVVIPAGSTLWVLDMDVPVPAFAQTWTQAGGDALRSGCWDCDLPTSTGVGETVAASAAASLVVGPNPARAEVTLRFSAPGSGRLDAALYDATGRLVRTIAKGVRFTGNGSLQWDGRDDSGQFVASGVYWVRVLLDPDDRAGSTTFVRSLTRLH